MRQQSRSAAGRHPDSDARARRLLELKARALQALGHPARLLILEALRDGERCVCEMGPILELRQPNVSQHLSVLKAAGLVASRRDGTRVIYRITDPAILEIVDLAREIIRRQRAEMAQALSQNPGTVE